MANYIIGLSGGIGSGKTAVSDRFAALGITVVDADIAARTVVEPGTKALQTICEHFGEDILLADGSLDRSTLRHKIFADADEKQWLEQLLHPLIAEEINTQLATAQGSYAMFVSPLLIEAGQDTICQRVCVVDVPEELQIQRTMARDNNNAEQVKAIMAAQASREQRLAKADDVIENWHGFDELDKAVNDLHQRYLVLANSAENQQTEIL